MKKICEKEPEILKSLMAGKDDTMARNHLDKCELCRETRDLFLMMQTVERNTRRSDGFRLKEFPDPRKLIERLAGQKDYRGKARQQILAILKWPRRFAALVTAGGLGIALGKPGPASRLLRSLIEILPEIPGDMIRGWLIPLTLLPVLVLTGYWLIEMLVSRRERNHRFQIT